MNKIFDLIHINNHSYMVEEVSTDFHQNTTIIHADRGVTTNTIHRVSEGEFRVLSSSNPSLKLPLLPQIEENVEQIATKYLEKRSLLSREAHFASKAFIDGYKAASSKKYTEGDIKAAFRNGWADREKHKNGNDPYYHNDPSWGEDGLVEYLKSVNPRPIKVEIEIIHSGLCKKESCLISPCLGDCLIPKVDENGYVIVKRWIYE